MTPGPRLVIVSAHFPPDFVSGGTLVPDRQARGLAALGWDVSVYAGAVYSGQAPLAAWDEDVDGLVVRWISIEAFTAWSDRRNFDNPGVVDDFRSHLAAVRPDVVHLHSVQTLGGGMVRAAKESGAAVVVTMHDFWWSCARQFLVDLGWVPCSPVVDAGVCECEVGRAGLEERNRWLRAELAHADLVLAPSAIAAAVLAANGVPAERLRVDENGLDEVPTARPRLARPGGAPVRFRYAGGPNKMKGSAVMADAARLLAGTRPEGWELLIHADAAELASEAPGPLPGAAQVVAPFHPDHLDDVLAATDVLVIPSVMRESHSLLTREALLRGVPVITSDSLGPEEVVVADENGLVVPSADPGALAAAMALAIDHPDRVARWSAAAVNVTIRRSADQLADLDATLRSLLAAPDAASVSSVAAEPTASLDRVLFVVGIDGAPLRYRGHLPAEALSLHGIDVAVRHYRDPEVAELARRADAIVVYRVPATVQVLDLLAEVRRDRPQVPLLFDVDDLIFDPDLTAEIPAMQILPQAEADLWMQGVRRYRTTMEACDAFIGSTEGLCRHAEDVVGIPAHRWANGVGIELAKASDLAVRRERRSGPLRVGYLSGTTTHDRDWAEVEAVLLEVLDEHPDVELWLGGHLNPSPAVARLGDRLVRLPMQDWRSLPGVLRDLDVNLAPLEGRGRFNEAKSAIKWLEAALVGTPTIASPTQPFAEAIRSGSNGFLAATPEEWRTALSTLLDDEVARRSIGARARRDALLGWSPRLQAARYLAILRAEQARSIAGRTRRPSTFVPVALDEPYEPTPLGPYVGATGATAPTPVAGPPPGWATRGAAAVRVRAAGVRRIAAEDGWGRVARRSAALVLRDARRLAGALRRRAARRP